MIEYRPFRNADPPQLLRLWHEGGLGRGAARGFSCDAFELLVFGQLHFDPQGLIVACDGPRIVGFVHAGFGANESETALSFADGVISAIIVHPEYRRRGIGRTLVQHAEAYLLRRGATSIIAGGVKPRDPFYLGIYGGSELSGFLESDPAAAPFFTALGYSVRERHHVYQWDLTRKAEPVDFRLVTLRRGVQLGLTDKPSRLTPWWATHYGRFDCVRFLLLPKRAGAAIAEVTCWGLDLYAGVWGVRAAGLTGLNVLEAERGKGYAKVLLLEVFRRLREESITRVEMHAEESNAAAVRLVEWLGCERVDAGHVFLRPDPDAANLTGS